MARRGTDHIVRSLNASGALLAHHSHPAGGHFDLIEAAHTGSTQ